jgi:tRNA (cytosine38-C5)-methyltransferase
MQDLIQSRLDQLKFDQSKESNTDQIRNENVSGQIKRSQMNQNFENCSQSESADLLVKSVKKLDEFVANQMGSDSDLYMDKETFLKSINSIDLVSVKSTRTSCFTKNYGRYLEGTGSILNVGDGKLDGDENTINVSSSSVRFFSPKEIANLHCFPNEFEFPEGLSTVQKWRLIGNSLNVLIVSVLIDLLTK